MIGGISPAVQFITARATQATLSTPATNSSGSANPQTQDRVTLSHQANNVSPTSFMELKGFGRNDMLTSSEIATFEAMKKDGNLKEEEVAGMANMLALDRYANRTYGLPDPRLDTSYINKLISQSHIENSAARDISQKALSFALGYLARYPVI